MKGLISPFNTLAIACLLLTAGMAWPAQGDLYSFGVVPQFEQRKLFNIWRPILDELEQRTQLRFKLAGSPKIPVFEQKYMQGEYDFAYMNPYHILKAYDSQGYLPLVRDGKRNLKGILVVRKESPITRLEEIDGKRVAFPAPNALGASLLMRAELHNLHGLTVVPHYVQTHSSVYLHVALGMTEAGGGIASTLNAQKPELRETLRVLYETRPMNPHPISVHPRVPETHREQVRQALLEMAQTEQGAALLAKIPMGDVVAASMEDYTPMSSWGLEAFYIPDSQPGTRHLEKSR